jgi:hypothetical protein
MHPGARLRVNAKIMNGTTSRVWRSPGSGLPAPSNGTFYSDLGFQNLWETSRAQPGEAGIITDYLGSKPGLGDAKSALEAFRADLPKMSPKMAESLDTNAVMPEPKRDNIRRCLKSPRSLRLAAVCNLPENIPAPTS